jgi:hypothetical protein
MLTQFSLYFFVVKELSLFLEVTLKNTLLRPELNFSQDPDGQHDYPGLTYNHFLDF